MRAVSQSSAAELGLAVAISSVSGMRRCRAGKGGSGRPAARSLGGRHCVPTSLRCSDPRPGGQLASFAALSALKHSRLKSVDDARWRARAVNPPLLAASDARRGPPRAAFAKTLVVRARGTLVAARSAVCAWGVLRGGEKRSLRVGARSAHRSLTSPGVSERSERSERSELPGVDPKASIAAESARSADRRTPHPKRTPSTALPRSR
jgi:hypothetical protein